MTTATDERTAEKEMVEHAEDFFDRRASEPTGGEYVYKAAALRNTALAALDKLKAMAKGAKEFADDMEARQKHGVNESHGKHQQTLKFDSVGEATLSQERQGATKMLYAAAIAEAIMAASADRWEFMEDETTSFLGRVRELAHA